jgi:tetratricopeptide (TPR) repeat protein
LRVFWKARGHTTEAVEALRALLGVPTAQEPVLLRSRALATAAYLLEQTGGYETAEEYCAEALAIARSAGDDYLVADLLDVRAFILLRRGQRARALSLIDQGLGLARRLEEPHLTARLLAARAFALDVAGDHAGAARDAVESVFALPPGR